MNSLPQGECEFRMDWLVEHLSLKEFAVCTVGHLREEPRTDSQINKLLHEQCIHLLQGQWF